MTWQFSPYFNVKVEDHPCVATTVNPADTIVTIKLWIDLYVDWDSVETPQAVTNYTYNVSTLANNTNSTYCPTDNLTLLEVRDAAGSVVASSVYSSYLTYDSSTYTMTIHDYGPIEVPTFTGLQIYFKAMQYLNSFTGKYFDLSIDYNLCRNMTISYSQVAQTMALTYESEKDFFGNITKPNYYSVTQYDFHFSIFFSTSNDSCPIVDYKLDKVVFKNGTEYLSTSYGTIFSFTSTTA